MNIIKRPRPIVLISVDGVGVAPPGPGNAVTLAKTPNLDKYWPLYPHTYLQAAGIYVGLPEGVDGNSEVGHLNLGAGKVIYQSLPRIDNSVKNDSFAENPILNGAVEHAKKNNSNLHIMGLFGTGKVHSSTDHFYALLKMAKTLKCDPDKVFIHAFADGRDSPPKSVLEVLDEVDTKCHMMKLGRIASIIGRFYAMDRDRRWEKTKLAYDLLTKGGTKITSDYHKAIEESYANNKTDEYLEGISVVLPGEDPIVVKDNDAVIFFNFRPDRATQISMAFEDEEFAGFARVQLQNIYFCGMAEYEKGFPRRPAFPAEPIEYPIGRVLAENGMHQLRISESEKFPHVTYFFNGGTKTQYPGEDWIEVPSPRDVATYDQKPEMSSRLVTDVAVEKIDKEGYDFILINYASGDMVAHTGVIDATVNAMQVVDECLGRVVEKTLSKNGVVIITADHGNAEEMLDITTGKPDTKHSVNPVPLLIISNELSARELPVGILADVAPTILSLMNLEKPSDMNGRNLLA
jgi:2,3-bisphosphoglycerate-independent phosphoglycerate mutase